LDAKLCKFRSSTQICLSLRRLSVTYNFRRQIVTVLIIRRLQV
jgi:hypothetical protein